MKTNYTVMVLIPTIYTDSRKTCEFIQNTEFRNTTELREHIEGYVGRENFDEEESNEILFFDLNDFMDEVNDQNIDNLTNYFISYVTIKN